jgi:outer membrane protein assembly factor BamB
VFGRTLSTACVHDGVCYIAELAGYVHCLDAETGKRHWYHNVRAPIWSSPYYVDGKIFMGTDDEVLYVFEHGTKKNILAEIDMFGKVRATPVVANGTMYVMTETKLYAIR